MLTIPECYIERKFQQYVEGATKRSNGDMNGKCPFCLEGSSHTKKRFNYYADTQALLCYNCGVTFNPISFLKSIDGLSFPELLKAIEEDGGDIIEFKGNNNYHSSIEVLEERPEVVLPIDTMNLMDEEQLGFYEDEHFVKQALREIKRRRLNTAVNRGALYLSLTDFIHKNRIIIPFHDETGRLTFYQSRSQTKKQMEMGKYLSCLHGRKTFYGLDRIDYNLDYAMMLEGPLDCFFVKNAFGGGGLKLNNNQQDVLVSMEAFLDIIYGLDNDFDNDEVFEKYIEYVQAGKRVFLWGGEFEKVKDFNEYAIEHCVDEIPIQKILTHVYHGEDAMKILEEKKRECVKNALRII